MSHRYVVNRPKINYLKLHMPHTTTDWSHQTKTLQKYIHVGSTSVVRNLVVKLPEEEDSGQIHSVNSYSSGLDSFTQTRKKT